MELKILRQLSPMQSVIFAHESVLIFSDMERELSVLFG